jgi:hypothetical protein
MFKDNSSFYPTPKNLINKMLSFIDFTEVKTVLEPSAGKGDLVEGIIKQFEFNSNYFRNRKWDIDTIELDENLQHILNGKGFRVIHNDFLTLNTYKKYDAIIMNPPFSEGEKHLLKAIEMQREGGKIVCLLNAETLKNPYNNARKVLLQELEKYSAHIEYIQNAFTDAERKTSVEVALIYIDIPKIEYNSLILDELKQEEDHKVNHEDSNNFLINADFIKGIVEQYNFEVKAGLKLIQEYNSLKPYMLKTFKGEANPVLRLEVDTYNSDYGESLENAYIKQIRKKYWEALFSNDQFMGLFTSNLKQKYMSHINELQNYDFSLYNIYNLRIQLSKEMIKGAEDTILDLFDEFSHKHHYSETSGNIHLYNGWKTNSAYKVNRRVIIPLNAFDSWNNSFYPTRYTVIEKLKDIEKVFNYLDGGLTEDIEIEDTLKFAQHYGDTKKIELKYFYVSFFKKGTCHIEFKNQELLHKFNLYGSQRKGWLPPSYGKKKYSEMTQEEKAVINEFEGEHSYNKVMNNQEYYIMNTQELLKLTS